MKKFLFHILIFSLIIFAASIVADIVISKGLKRNLTYAQSEIAVWNDIYSGKASSELIILGSSRSWVHIDPAAFENKFKVKAYNLGIDGQNFDIINFRWQEYLKHDLKPSTIIFSLDAFTLQKPKDLYNYKQFRPYLYGDFKMAKVLLDYNGLDRYDFAIPLVRYFGDTEAFVESAKGYLGRLDNKILRYRGFKSMDRIWNGDLKMRQAQAAHLSFPIEKETAQAFEEFIKQSKLNGIKIIFVYTPEYYEAFTFVKNRAEIFNFYNKISEKYDIPFLDYSKSKICFDKKYFYNAEHMNIRGTAIFNEQLVDTLYSSKELLPRFRNF